MNAVMLRNLLIAGVILAFGGVGALIYFASGFLESEVTKTTHAEIDAELSHDDLARLKVLEKTLQANKASVDKAAQIVSDSKQYQYQDQIVNDINAYAAQTGVSVTGYDFGNAFTPNAKSTQKLPQIKGVKAISVALTLASPMSFDNYLRFVKAVESNLTKMQVSGINITPDEKDMNSISNPSVVLIVYVR